MTDRFFMFAFILSACLAAGSLTFSTTHHILILGNQAECSGDKTTLDKLFLENLFQNQPGIILNFTILEGSKESLTHHKTLSKFHEHVSHGVSLIVSLDEATHPNLIDIFASHFGIPMIKLFNSNAELLKPVVVKQEQSTILHMTPDSVETRVQVIFQLLTKYGWNSRVVVISQQTMYYERMVSKLMMILRRDESTSKIYINFTMSHDSNRILRAVNILSGLRATTAVMLMEQDLSSIFMDTAQLHGLANLDCVWIFEYSLAGMRDTRIPFPGKTIGIRLASKQNNNSTAPRCEGLLRDSLEIFRKALQGIVGQGRNIPEEPRTCNSRNRWESGNMLYEAMNRVQINGLTGRIQFDPNGFRANIDYEVDYWIADETQPYEKRIVIGRYVNNVLTILPTGWPPEIGADILERKLSHGEAIKVAVIFQEPYVVFNEKDTVQGTDDICAFGLACTGTDGVRSCCTGYCIDLLKLLMKDIGFSVRIHKVKDGKYGALNHTSGQWSGLIGEVLRGDADVALGDLTINQQRSTVVDFTHPFIGAGMGVLVKAFHRSKSNWTGFLDPFSVVLWITILTTVNVVLFCMWLLERFSPYGQRQRRKNNKQSRSSFSFVEAIWFTWSLVFQSFDVGKRPKSFACRIVGLLFAFGMLILVTSYTANLAAFLVVEEEVLPLDDAGIRDFKLQNPPAGFKIATVQDSSFERFFQATHDPVLRRVWQNMRPNSVRTFSEGIQQLNSGKLQAFVADHPTFEHFAATSQDCSFKIVGQPFFQSGFGLAVKKNSSLTTKISKALIQYEAYDIAKTLKYRWFAGACSVDKTDDRGHFTRLASNDLAGLFLVICVGVIGSWMFFALETYTNSINRSSIYSFSRNGVAK